LTTASTTLIVSDIAKSLTLPITTLSLEDIDCAIALTIVLGNDGVPVVVTDSDRPLAIIVARANNSDTLIVSELFLTFVLTLANASLTPIVSANTLVLLLTSASVSDTPILSDNAFTFVEIRVNDSDTD